MSPQDREWKLKICGIPDERTCFVTKKSGGVGRGDHVFETKGYFKLTGKFGVDDDWNILPVAGSLNNTYKIFQFKDGHVKNVGFQNLTRAELAECSKKQKHIYNVIRRWRAYTKRRNIRLSFRPSAEQKRILNQARVLHQQHAREHSHLFSKYHRQGSERLQMKKSLQCFISEKLIVSEGTFLKTSKKSLLGDSYYVDKQGHPIGTKLDYMRKAYKEWRRCHSNQYHYSDRCSVSCAASGHPSKTCRSFKTHLCRHLGLRLGSRGKLWRTVQGKYYYKGCFLRK